MEKELRALVKRISSRAYLDSEEQIGKWIQEYCATRNEAITSELRKENEELKKKLNEK